VGVAWRRRRGIFVSQKARVKFVAAFIISMVALVSTMGATFLEIFSREPSSWRIHNPGAFAWDATAQNLAVTWDSRQTNAFFYYKLPMTLTRRDSFAVEFTLHLEDIRLAINPAKTATFPLCLGFLNLSEATRTNYYRGSGVNAQNGPRSVVEFAYFPEDVFEATVGPIIASTNNQIAFSHSHPVQMLGGETYRVRMAFDADAQVLSTTMQHNGAPYGEPETHAIRPLPYPAESGDFRVDAFSIHSYSDAGQVPEKYAGSLLAHGRIDDVVITWPEPPLQSIAGARIGGIWTVSFDGKVGWNYALERTSDFARWDRITQMPGVEGAMQLIDETPLADSAFYRVVAERP
jgi:hypothetical protein